ncbi:Histone lysine demethylase PHF8-like protein, partial [Leptotrombidium deliense]
MKMRTFQPKKVENSRVSKYVECGECKLGIKSSDFFLHCDCCEACFHGLCVNIEEYEYYEIETYHCSKCESLHGRSSAKLVCNIHRRDKSEMDDNLQTESGTPQFLLDLMQAELCDGEQIVDKVKGQSLTMGYLLKRGFNRPIVVECIDGLDMQVPNEDFDERVVMSKIGTDYVLDVFNARRQEMMKMKMLTFVRLMQTHPSQRDASVYYDCHSLEISRTELSNMVRVPRVVNNMCWISSCWPQSHFKPELLKYCVISMERSYLDFHIDYGGSSMWYHVFKGQKIFFLVEPTINNIALYEQWKASPNQSETPFYRCVEKCYKFKLNQGSTLFIPGGWIHAVYSSCDSIAFAGNFLHNFSIPFQLQINELEQRLYGVNSFPYFELVHWYAAPALNKFLQDNAKKIPSEEFINHVNELVNALKDWLQKSKKSHDNCELLAPCGVNCQKIITDLMNSCRKAKRVLEGGELIEKHGRKRKSDDINEKETRFLLSAANNKRNKSKQEEIMESENCSKIEEMEFPNGQENQNGFDSDINQISDIKIECVSPSKTVNVQYFGDDGAQ